MIRSLMFGLLCAVVTLVTGEDALISTPHPISNSEGKCSFPEFLTVELLRPGTDLGLTIALKRDDLLPTERSVLLFSDMAHNNVEEVQVTSDLHNTALAYHSQQHGAAFTVKCSRGRSDKSYFLLEGSVFLGKYKFKVTPTPSWKQNIQVFPSHVTIIYTMTQIQEFKTQDSRAIFPSSSSYLKKMARLAQTGSRHKRDVTLPVNYTIDLLPVVDFPLYERFHSINNGDRNLTINSILDYLANLFTAVSMRLDTLKLENRTLQIRLLPPFLLTNSSQSPYNASSLQNENGKPKIEAINLLNFFKNWLVLTKNLGTYDHAMFITSIDISGGADSGIKFNVTKGLAFIGTLCRTNGESSSIVTDKGAYQSEGVVAHELAHSMGSLHDGQNNSCTSSDRFIMSDSTYPETNANMYHPWEFSECSSNKILSGLKELERDQKQLQTCLIDSKGTSQIQNSIVSANEQCQQYFGSESFICRGTGLPSLDRLCDEFYCHIPGTSLCERLTAATGTCCGTQKKCKQGQCIDAIQGECPVNVSCPLGDQPGVIFNNKTCAQLDSAYCYSDDIYIKCCSTCEKHRNTLQGCTFGDKQLGCVATDCGSYFENGIYKDVPYDFICCSTCQRQCNDRSNVVLQSGEVYTCNMYIINQGNKYICYSKSILEDHCCKSCEDARDVTNPGCPWGDRNNCTTLWKKPSGYKCSASELQNCCDTCQKLPTVIMTASLSSTLTTTMSATTKPSMSITTKPSSTIKQSTTMVTSTTKTLTTITSTPKALTTVTSKTKAPTTVATTKTSTKITSATKIPTTVSVSTKSSISTVNATTSKLSTKSSTTSVRSTVLKQSTTSCTGLISDHCGATVIVINTSMLCILLMIVLLLE